MSNGTVQDALKHEEVSTFTGGNHTTTTRTGLIEGEYLGHISNTRSIVRPVRPHFQARIYNFDVIVAPENKGLTYQYEDIDGSVVELTGEQFVGSKLLQGESLNSLTHKRVMTLRATQLRIINTLDSVKPLV